MTPRHMFGLRPLPGFSDYTTPIAGLYTCGSSSWPGGTVTGVPGHNASRKILADLPARLAGLRRGRRVRAAAPAGRGPVEVESADRLRATGG